MTSSDLRLTTEDIGKNLRELYGKLYLIDRSTLTPKQKEAWREDFLAVLDALEAYENTTLANLVKRLRSEAAALRTATAALVEDLRGVQDAVTVIKAIGAALAVFTQIAALLA